MMGDCHEDVIRPTCHFDRQQMLVFPSFVFLVSTRDHSSLVKSTYI